MVGVTTISYFWYGTKPSINFTSSSPVVQSEGFETFPTVNNFFQINNPSLMPGTTKGWESGDAYAHGGTSSIKNQPMSSIAGTPQYSRIDINFTVPSYARAIKIGYWYYQDSEVNFDGLKVYLNSTLIHNYITSGTYGAWTYGEIETSITGAKTLTFEYFKDGKTDGGVTDSVYIDDLSVSYTYDNITETPGTELIRFDSTGSYRLMYHLMNDTAPPISFLEQRVPFQPGSMYQYTDIQPRDFEMGIQVYGNSPSDLRNKIRNLTNIINVDGALYCRRSDGSERRLYCRYKEGLEGETTSKTKGVGFYQKLILIFRAFDPFWYSVDFKSEVTENFMRYNNDGSYEAYPVIIVGPCSTPDVAIWKTGTEEPTEGSMNRLKINYTVPTGRKLIIDMKRRTVKLDDGTNVYSSIDSIANKFQSIPNDSTNYNIDVDIAGAESNGRYHVYIEKPHWGV